MTKRVPLDSFHRFLERRDDHAPRVSDWSVGMHIEHCCLAMIGICEALTRSTPPPPRSRFSAIRTLVLTFGTIPRGRARAPEAVTPGPSPQADHLRGLLREAERGLGRTEELSPQAWFEHFALGVLNRDQTLRFLRVHNRHHERIIRDILTHA